MRSDAMEVLNNDGRQSRAVERNTYTGFQAGLPSSGFFLVTIAASKDRKKARRAAEEGFEILVGPQKLTRFEKARIVGARSLQLAMGAPSFVPIDESIRDSIALAMMELASDALPLSIRRSLPNGHSQDIPIKYLL